MAKCDTPQIFFLQVAIAVPLDRLFDYLAPDNCDAATLQPGVRVLVPFGKGHKIGILLAIRQHSEFDKLRMKQIEQILDNEPLLSTADLKLLQWASHYYHHPLGEVLACAFPVALRQGKPVVLEQTLSYSLTALGRETQP
jgi:primosomal protein N' (replication factor Y)